MPYETAPATTLLAAFCACCARPLVDAVSVETGVGPECRRRHGYNEAQELPSWRDVAVALRGIELPESFTAAEATDDVRSAANILVRLVAVEQAGSNVAAYVNAVRALGFVQLADRISERVAPIRIAEGEDNTLAIRTPFSPEANEAFRRAFPRSWDPVAKVRRVPASARRELFGLLRKCYPGATAIGPKGIFTIPEAS
ncbi:MAG: hypothetical protein HOW73_43240 [Polyangiaceae bacterium]|nr:hypothetical protein [Polyangiaceae bacterium]